MVRPNLAARLAQAAGAPPPGADAHPKARPEAAPPQGASGSRAAARKNKTMVAGYFSPELATAVKMIALERGVTLQALIGEGLDEVLRKYGRRPMGER